MIDSQYVFLSCLFSGASPQVGGHRDIFCDGFVPSSTSVAPMFPFYENANEWDEFGEVINPDDYIIKEEDVLELTTSQPGVEDSFSCALIALAYVMNLFSHVQGGC
eukprot:Gb_28459 [translate_table: standard]